ncbi:MAG: HU domain-containing protein [Mucilaginibacter sp.]
MDLAIYINELLGLKGEVNVPGIGFFEQKRVSGYYNEREKKFYPPHHEIIFDPESKDDDGLAAYISTKKNISPASAKYFIDKYTSGLKAQASEQKVDITGLGHLYYEYSVLSFKADKLHGASDPSFYGLAPVKADKNEGIPKIVDKPKVKPEPVAETPVKETPVEPVEVAAVDDEQSAFTDTRSYIPQEVEEDEGTGRRRPWVVVLLIVIVLLLGFGVLYQYKPTWFGRKEAVDTTIIIRSAPPAIKKPDTTKASAVKDTAAPGANPSGTIKPAIDTFATKRFELLAGAFPSKAKANLQMEKLKKLGLQPRLLAHATGPLNKITLGTFFDRDQAVKTRDSILKVTGMGPGDIYVQSYNPIKK